jgi:hypothetical protein
MRKSDLPMPGVPVMIALLIPGLILDAIVL